MTLELVGSLVVLAILDSTSIGTLFVPIVLLLTPGRLRAVPILGYLATIATFYLVLGLAIALGAGPLLDDAWSLLEGRRGYWVELGAGVALFLLSFRFDPKRRARQGKSPTVNWTERVSRAAGSPRTLMILALSAGMLEVATMFPYLGAIALLAGAGLGPASTAGMLAGYCVLMILPALIFLCLRLALSDRVTPLLMRANRWFERHAVSATGWILAIVGFLLARDAAFHLGFFDAWLND